MKVFRIILSLILVFVFAFLAGCSAGKKGEKDTTDFSSETETQTETEPYVDRAKVKSDEIVAFYTDIADTVYGSEYSNAEAVSIIYKCGDRFYDFGDRLLEAILSDMSESYGNADYTPMIAEEDAVKAVKDYAEYYRSAYDNTNEQMYSDIVNYIFDVGSGASAYRARYRFDCGVDYYTKIFELAKGVMRNDEKLIEILDSFETEMPSP